MEEVINSPAFAYRSDLSSPFPFSLLSPFLAFPLPLQKQPPTSDDAWTINVTNPFAQTEEPDVDVTKYRSNVVREKMLEKQRERQIEMERRGADSEAQPNPDVEDVCTHSLSHSLSLPSACPA